MLAKSPESPTTLTVRERSTARLVVSPSRDDSSHGYRGTPESARIVIKTPGSGKHDVSKRSQSVPRISRHISTTLACNRRTEYNLEKVKAIADAAEERRRERQMADAVITPETRPKSAHGTYTKEGKKTLVVNKSPSTSTPKFLKTVTTRQSANTAFCKTSLKDVLDGMTNSAAKALENKNLRSRLDEVTPSSSRDHQVLNKKDDKQTNRKETNVNLRFKLNVQYGKNHETTPENTPETSSRKRRNSSPLPRRISSSFSLPDPGLDVISRAKVFLKGVQVHNTVKPLDSTDETKTSVSVGVRIRPFSSQELKKGDKTKAVSVNEKKKVVIVNDKQRDHEFEFTHIFDSSDQTPRHDQECVYNIIGKPLLDHSLDGYNSCLFAYGATGSGKTYSMTGDEKVFRPQDEGIIPRLIRDLFLNMNLDSTVSMSYIEIYNEEIFNLLEGNATTKPPEKKFPYRVREHPVFGPYIPKLPAVVVESCEELLSCWHLGNINRAKAATACNDYSSRSHAILKIIVEQKYPEDALDSPLNSKEEIDCETASQASTGDRLVSVINLVDLAGSERCTAAQTTGSRFKEGTAINESLLTLGKVIAKLSSCSEDKRSRSHIPYRESTLTFLLKESLGGNSKTCMLATISPSSLQVEETMSTLRYAAKASRIVNTVRINEDPKIRRIRMLEKLLADAVKELEDMKKSSKSGLPVIIDSPCTSPESSMQTCTSSPRSPATGTKKESVKNPSVHQTSQDKKNSGKNSTPVTPTTESSLEVNQSEKKPQKDNAKNKAEKHKSSDSFTDSSPAKKDKKTSNDNAKQTKSKTTKDSSTQETPKTTKESAVNTESTPTAAKKSRVERVVVQEAPPSTLLENIHEIFDGVVGELKSEQKRRSNVDHKSQTREKEVCQSKETLKSKETASGGKSSPVKRTSDTSVRGQSSEKTPVSKNIPTKAQTNTDKKTVAKEEQVVTPKSPNKTPAKSPVKQQGDTQTAVQTPLTEVNNNRNGSKNKNQGKGRKGSLTQDVLPVDEIKSPSKSNPSKGDKKSPQTSDNKKNQQQGKKKNSLNEVQNESDLTFMSAADNSSILNNARIESSDFDPSRLSNASRRNSVVNKSSDVQPRKLSRGDTFDLTEEESRHVNFRDTVMVQSYQVSMTSESSVSIQNQSEEDDQINQSESLNFSDIDAGDCSETDALDLDDILNSNIDSSDAANMDFSTLCEVNGLGKKKNDNKKSKKMENKRN